MQIINEDEPEKLEIQKEKEKVLEVGGLMIIGSERHESFCNGDSGTGVYCIIGKRI